MFNPFLLFTHRTLPSYKKEDKKLDKLSEKDKEISKKQEPKSGKSDSVSSGPDTTVKDEKKHGGMFNTSQF